jgi:acetyl esterase/lipase
VGRAGEPLLDPNVSDRLAKIASVPLPEDVTATPGRLGGIPVVTVETPGNDSSAVMLCFHGGAYALGPAADVARRVGVRAVSVDYRPAPEHLFPAAVDDALAACHALLADGTPSSEAAFAGEPAGGGLVVATLVALKEAGRGSRPCSSRSVRTRSCWTTPYDWPLARPSTTWRSSCGSGPRSRTSSGGSPRCSTTPTPR